MDDKIRDHAWDIGNRLEAKYPTRVIDGCRLIPYEAVGEIGETITLVVAEILQSWLDAGSERDVTLEELTGPITNHVRGWSDHVDNQPPA